MRYSPKRNTKALYRICFLLLFCAIFIFALGEWIGAYRGAFQAFALLPLSAFLYLNARYALSDYEYLLEDSSLIVVKIQGKRSQKLCDIELSESIALYSRDEFRAKKPTYDLCYNYAKNFASGDRYYYLFSFNGKTAALIFEPDAEMRSEILRFLS